jgi:Flp pilus assembly protein TadD
MAMLQRGARADAVRLLELVWSRDRSYGSVATVLKGEYQSRGMDAFAAGRLEEAIAHWREALRIDPDDERTRAYLSRARLHLARMRELSGP